MSIAIHAQLLGEFRESIPDFKRSVIYETIVLPKESVLQRFQLIFSQEHLPSLTKDEFYSFLLFENNRHWTGLHRQGRKICQDMSKLRSALKILIDKHQPVEDRLDTAISMITGMGKNIATAVLTIVSPDLYGVWNNRSEALLKKYNIWPDFDRGESFGKRYVKVNDVLCRLRDELNIDLWALDAFWWYLDQNDASDEPHPILETTPSSEQRFGLERHLHDFLRDNWNQLELGREWEIYKEPGDDEAGYEYPCNVGRIDLLAKHRESEDWLVIIAVRLTRHCQQWITPFDLRHFVWRLEERFQLCTLENVELEQLEHLLEAPADLGAELQIRQ